MKKKVISVFCVSIVLLVLSCTCILGVKFKNGDMFGIKSIYINESFSGEATLMIDYFGITGYRLTALDDNFVIHSHEHKIQAEELGDNCISVRFADATITTSLREKYPPGRIHELKEVPTDCKGEYNIWISLTDDHFVTIYIGTDNLIDFKDKDFQKSEFGKVRIAL